MEKISSRNTFLRKWVVPGLWVVLVAISLADVAMNERDGERAIGLVILAFSTFYGALLYARVIHGAADEVHVAGDHFVVRKRSQELRVPMKDVTNIDQFRIGNLHRVTLRLRQAGKLGGEIAFLPRRQLRFNPFARLVLVDNLIMRVDRARLGA